MEYYFNPNQQRTEFIMFVHHQRKHYLLFPVLCLIYQICSIDAFKHNMNKKKKGTFIRCSCNSTNSVATHVILFTTAWVF